MRSFFSKAVFLLTKYVTALQETKMRGGYLYWWLAHKKNNSYLWLRRKYFRSEMKRKASFSFAFHSLIRTFAA
jgi:hypothetical protein